MPDSSFTLKDLTSLREFALFMVLLCSSGAVSAQEEPMVFLTSHSAAGSSGVAAAIMAPRMEEYLGRSIVFKYNQGSSAAVGDAPDGNTILMTTIGYTALHPVWVPNFELDPLTDLRPVTRLAVTPDVLIIRSGLGIDSMGELVAYAAAADEPLSYFHIAPASIHRVELAAIFNEFGIRNVALDSSMRRLAYAMLLWIHPCVAARFRH